jgi:UDP-N-acetylmuramyl pentapeptide phosphotransferase/UDP-N-acetylglucosamine-1-phosphate transferase
LIVVAVFAATSWATGALIEPLRRRAVLDRPNERSSHSIATPRGGGLAVMLALLPAWALFIPLGAAPPATVVAVLGAAFLALVSFADDLRSRHPLLRLLAQAVAVAAGIAALPDAGGVFQGLLPPVLDRVVSGLLWLWFVNLYNFMDGIDGITGTETAFLGAGLALCAFVNRDLDNAGQIALGLATAAAALGFLRWNWQPARIFLGDVGSVPLGYLLGWLLLATAAAGAWTAALVLPFYYLADASWTLGRRALRGEKIWRPHREHLYQKAVQRGMSHAAVVRRILALNLVLLVLALVL